MPTKFGTGRFAKVEVQKEAESTFFDLDGVREFNEVNPETEELDITYMKSPARQKEFMAGDVDNGEVSVTMLRSTGSPTDILLKELLNSGENVKIRFTVPATYEGGTASISTFAGFVKSYERPVSYTGVMEATVTFRISAEIVG